MISTLEAPESTDSEDIQGMNDQPTQDHSMARQRLRLWLQMLKATRHVESRLRENFRERFDTTLPRFDVMAALYAAPDGMRMSELSQHLVVSNGNVTGVVDRLVKDGLVTRRTVEADRRASTVRLTEAGRAQMMEMSVAHMEWIDALFEQTTEVDAARGIAIMLDIRGASSTRPGSG